MDEVVQGGRALIIVHLRSEQCPHQAGARPFPQPSLPDVLYPVSTLPPRQSSAIPSTYRPGQVTPHGLLLHQLQSDVDVKLAAILDIFMAAQGMLTGGVERQDD